jgi:hypothetical protein
MRILTLSLSLFLTFLMLGALGPGNPATADDEQANLSIFADAQVMRIAGMPEMPELPKIPGLGQLSAKIPGLGGAPMRMLSVRLFAPGIAPDDATASLAIPAGLKLGPKLDLELYRPAAKEEVPPAEVPPTEAPEYTIIRYWGSSPTVKEGQPETFNWGALTDEQKAVLREQMEKSAKKSSYFFKGDWTTGYWPNGKATGIVDAKASLVGKYALTTTFTGNVAFDVPKGVDFLNGIKLTSPDLTKLPPLDEAMTFRWEPVPNVLGYYAMITGMKGKDTMITWSSSEVKDNTMMGESYLGADRVAELVQANVLMAPDRKDFTVPAGIFKDCDTVILMMTGYGPGVEAQGTPLPSLQSRTTLMVTLGGKAAEKEMGGGNETEGGQYYP